MPAVHARLEAAYLAMSAAQQHPEQALQEPFQLGGQWGLEAGKVLAVVQPFVKCAREYLMAETACWWQPPLVFAQLCSTDQARCKGAAAYWAAMGSANSGSKQPEGWDMHGILTSHLPMVKEMAATGIAPPSLARHLHLLFAHVPVTNAGAETALKVIAAGHELPLNVHLFNTIMDNSVLLPADTDQLLLETQISECLRRAMLLQADTDQQVFV